MSERAAAIRTPDRRLRVFISSTLGELAAERAAVRDAVEALRLTPVMFELGARPHPPRELYRAYLEQSDVFVGVYWKRYGWVAPGEKISGLEDEYRLAGERPRLLYIKEPADERDPRLVALLREFSHEDRASYKRFRSAADLKELVANDLAIMLSERFPTTTAPPILSERLPMPPDRLLGRDPAIAEVLEQFRAGTRLVTLTGIGGIGKTRLALEIAQRRAPELPTSVISLAETAGADEALREIASHVGARTDRAHIIGAIARVLGSRAVFLVLDNLEQIADIAVALADLVETVPAVQILATSRRSLRIRAEQVVPVTSLSLPAAPNETSDVAASPAVQLLLARARRSGAVLDGSDATITTVAEIVRRLDGIPLALELAASRLRFLSPAELLARLDDRFSVLQDGAADLPERQRSLRATLDSSHALLAPDTRILYARTSVFRGGWTLTAADAVCGGDVDALDGVAELVDASLVHVDTTDPVPRFTMLETIREDAAGHLREIGDDERVANAHLDYHLGLGQVAQPSLCGPGQRDWVARLEAERPNLRAAVDHALARERFLEVVELAWDVIVLYFVRDAVHEPASWLERVASRNPELDRVTDAKLRSLHALTRIHRGTYAGLPRDLVEPLEVFRDEGMQFEAAVTLHQLGFVRYALDRDVSAAISALRASSQLFDEVAHDWGVALAEAMLGSILAADGSLDEAEACQRRSLDRARRIDNEPLVVQALQQLAFIRLLDADEGTAFTLLDQSAALLQHNTLRTEAAYCLDALGLIALIDGDTETAALAVSVAAAERERLDVAPWPSLADSIERVVTATERRLGPEAFAELRHRASSADLFATLDRVRGAVTAHRDPDGSVGR